MKRKKSVYQRIMAAAAAAEKGVGVRFSAQEVLDLSYDDAILTRVYVDDEDAERSDKLE